MLIGMRALQGVGAALLTPGSLAILQASFRKEDRATAVGAWSGLGGVATAFGPIVGGAAGRGRAVGLAAGVPDQPADRRRGDRVVSRRYIPEIPGRAGDRPAGRAPARSWPALGLGGADLRADRGPGQRLAGRRIAITVAGVLLLGGFVLVESRKPDPLMPLGLFAVRQFSAANLVTFAVYAALAGALFLLPVQLQLVAGFSPVAGRRGDAAGHRDDAAAVGPDGSAGRSGSGRACR